MSLPSLSLSFSVVLEKTIDIEARFSKEDFRYDGRKEEEISSRGNIFPTRQKMGKEEEKSGKKWSNKAWPNNKYLRREETARGGFSRRPTILRTFYDLAYECARLRDFFTVSRSSESFPACCLGEPSTVPFFPPVKCALSAREIDAASFAQISDKWRTKEGGIAVLIVNDDGTEFGGGPRAVPLRLTIRR